MSSHIFAFSCIAAGRIVMPGADLPIVLRNALTGRRAGLAAGAAGGLAPHTRLAAAGVAALFAASEALFRTMRIAGAAYVIHLGGRALLGALCGSSERGGEPVRHGGDESGAGGRSPGVGAARPPGPCPLRGFVTNAAHPKAPLLLLSLMPPSIPDDAPLVPMARLLSAIVVAMGLLRFPLVATLASSVGRFPSTARSRRLMDGAGGVALTCPAGVLLLESTP
ncbi:LysE family transporter [Streptomyces sp. NPDC006368]|uniref:LysE family transporter n=1 Tax=Streptomyces sp. NPDC006368 TaxID=3156760 RepID=UPI0033B0180D